MIKVSIWKMSFAVAVAAGLLAGSGNSQPFVTVAQAAETAAVEDVTFSQGSGAYNEAFSLTLSAGENTIYYTTDGSDPTTSETRVQYTAPLSVTDRKGDANVVSAIDPALFDSANLVWDDKTKTYSSKMTVPSDDAVDKATVIKAVAMDGTGNYSAVQTNTYFIGAMTDHIQGIKESCKASGMDLAIMSISVDKDDFFDSKKGIYVHGDVFDKALQDYLDSHWNSIYDNEVFRQLDANYKQRGKDWERKAHIDYFESDGDNTSCKLQQDCGIRVQGNYSRSDLLKGLRLYAREEYGKKNFKYAFFPDSAKNDAGEAINKYKKIVLRNGGNCAFTSKFNDAYWQSLIRDLKCETQGSRVCVVYLNGEYWGLYILQEDYDDNYFEETHGVNKDDVVLYKGDAEASSIGYDLDEGKLPEGETDISYYFKDLLTFFDEHDSLVKQKDYDAFCKIVDPVSVMDYFAASVWVNNKWDWPGKNWSVWKTTQVDPENPYADGRWRFCFYDMDFGGVSGSGDAYTNTIDADSLLWMNSKNPIVKTFSYLMTNKGFRDAYNAKLTALSSSNFKKTTALDRADMYKDTYQPLFSQYFNRYPYIDNAANRKTYKNWTESGAIYGGYATYQCIVDFVNNREDTIPTIVEWVNDYLASYTDSGNTDSDGTDGSGNTENDKNSVQPPSADTKVPAKTNKTTKAKKKKISTLKITGKKGKKYIKVTTVKKAKVTVKVNRRIIRNGKKIVKSVTYSVKKNKNGKFQIKLSKKLKKKDKITVIVRKSGYATKTKTIKIK